MKLEFIFIVETDHYPSTFDEMDLIETTASMMGADENSIEYSIEEVI